MASETPDDGRAPPLVARVISVNPDKRYAATVPHGASSYPGIKPDTSVTFSLDGAWQAAALPQVGEIVELSELRFHSKGWRAHSARPFVPDKIGTQHQQRSARTAGVRR